ALALLQGDVAAMEEHAARAGALFLGTRGDPGVAAAIVRLIGEGHLGQGQYDAAIDHFRQALDCYRPLRGPQESPEMHREIAAIMRRLGLAHRYLAKAADGVAQSRHRAAAISWYERALALSREARDDHATALALSGLQSVLRLSGRGAHLERVDAAAGDALAIARRLHSPLCLAH